MITAISLFVLAYLMGSICSAVIVCKMFSLPDPRNQGSKNPGATNVLRLFGKKYAVWVLTADILKGMIPVLIAKLFILSPMAIGFTAFAAVLGHMYPVFFNFKGGKGVATAVGALIGFQFIVGMMVVGTWLLVLKIYRYSSLAAIVAMSLAPFYAVLISSNINVTPPIFLMAMLILIKHSKNMGRLIDGNEPKVKLQQDSAIEEIMHEDPIKHTAEPTAPLAKQNIEAHTVPVKMDTTVNKKKSTVSKTRSAPKLTEKKTAPKTSPKVTAKSTANKTTSTAVKKNKTVKKVHSVKPTTPKEQ